MLPNAEGTIVLAGAWCLIGYVTGFAFAVVVFWRRITKVPDTTLRMLRMAVADAQALAADAYARADELARVCGEKQRVIDQQTQQIGQLYRDSERITRLYVEAKAKDAAEVA